MSDLIDRAKLLKVLEERKKPNNGGEDGTKERYRYMQWLTDYNAVIEAPPAEPKKGKWIKNNSNIAGPFYHYSVCEWKTYNCDKCGMHGARSWKYCPNCGARMEGNDE